MTASSFLVVGANHRSCTGSLRERMATDEAEVPGILERLKSQGFAQAIWLATCDRVEVQAVHGHPAEAALAAAAIMAQRAGLATSDLEGQLYTLTGEAAVRHVFAVASSLDSQVVGEPHVLGQVKSAHRLAIASGLSGPDLEAVLQAAYGVAKRVRTETVIAEGPTSIAAAAVQIARDLFGEIAKCSGLLIGLGDMGALMVDQLRETGLSRLTVSAHSDRRAEAGARRLDAHHAPFADLDTTLAAADIVVTASGLGRYMLSGPQVEAALKRRRRRPIFLIDAAIPADVAPEVAKLDGAFVYDLSDLERVALAGRVNREQAMVQAWSLVDQAVAAFVKSRAERAAVSAVVSLRAHFEAERDRLLAEQPGLDAVAATRLLVNRLLHHPSEVLRAMAAEESGAGLVERAAAERLLRQLFRLQAEADTVTPPRVAVGADGEGER